MAVRDEIATLEELILGVLLRNPDLALTEPIELDLFTKWKGVIHAIIKLSGRGVRPDMFTIGDEVGGDSALIAELGLIELHTYGVKDNYGHYLKTLRSKVYDLRIFEKLREGMKLIASGNTASSVLGQLVTESLSHLATASERQYSFTSKEMMRAMVDKLEQINSGDAFLGVKTGISKLDSVLGSLHPSDLVIVGARPGVGKTALGVTVMLNSAKAGHRVGFISTEMSIDQIAFRVSAQAANMDSKKYRKADFNEEEYSRISASSMVLAEYNMRVCDKPVMRVSDVALQCRAWDLDGGLDLVIVDYLTRIKPDKTSGSQNLDIGEIATSMKNLARDLKIPVVVLAQLNRNTANRADSKPRMSDLRDSGIIEQEADSILLLHREESDKDIPYSSIIVDKNRHGECVEAVVNFDAPTMRWHCDENF